MRPYLMERIFTPTLAGRCQVICKELGIYNQGDYIFKYGALNIISTWVGNLTIDINHTVLYRRGYGWMPSVKKECKHKIKSVIDDQFIKALDVKFTRMEEQRKQEQRDADKRNQVCGEFNVEDI